MPRSSYDFDLDNVPDDDEEPALRRDPDEEFPDPREYGSYVRNGVRVYEEDFLYDPIGRDVDA